MYPYGQFLYKPYITLVFMGYNPQEPPRTFNPESLQVLDVVRSRYRNRLLNKHSAAVEFFHREKIAPLQMSVF